MKASNVLDVVRTYLKHFPRTRDDDNMLIASIWAREVNLNFKRDCDTGMSADEFLTNFATGKFSSPESIRRCRQKLQQENPQYRGHKWYLRHKQSQVTKDDLNNTPEFYPGGTP